MLAKIGQLITENWPWFAIGGGVLVILLLTLIIVLCARRKKKKSLQKLALDKKETETKKEEDSTAEVGVQSNVTEHQSQSEKVDQHDLDKFLDLLRTQAEGNSKRNVQNNLQNNADDSDNVQKLKQRILEGKVALEKEISEIESLKNKNQDSKEDEELNRIREQYELLTNYLQKKESEQSAILREVMQDEEMSKTLSDRMYLDALDELIQPKPPVVELETTKSENKQMQSVEKDVDEMSEPDDDDEDGVTIKFSQRYTLQEALRLLPAQQRKYFGKLRDYADSKDGAIVKEHTHYIIVGVGNSPYIKLSIKRNVVVASFRLENEENWDLKYKQGIKSAIIKETSIKILNENDLNTAKRLIDARVEQVEKEKEYKRLLRNEKRRKAKAGN